MGNRTYAADWLDSASPDLDLRKRRADALNERIVQRADWLGPDDRAVVLAMFADGYSAAEIARIGNTNVRTVRTRIHRIVTRLGDPRTAYVVRHAEGWSRTRKKIGRAIFVQGMSLRETASELSMSFYLVRRHREAIEAMFEADLAAAQTIARARKNTNQWR
ncbi:MAG: sigma-70 region 4 domain-containing protein [Phycisphaerales bacterium]|nr:sigma-70 region 4 domain-containing protein [Phycisphaerales bacterium]